MPSLIVPWSITGALFILLVVIFLNPEKAQVWGSWIASWFASRSSYFARRTISGKIQGRVNQFSKTFDGEASGIMPCTLKVEWVKDIDREALLQEEGVVVVRLGHQHNELQKALALAMLTFCERALLPISRLYLTERFLRSVDLVTTKKMLGSSNEQGSLDYFLNNVVRPEIEEGQDLRGKCQIMETLDDRGLFSRILLRELHKLGQKLYPNTSNGSPAIESEELVDFLQQIANKAPDEDVELLFKKNWFRIGVILVAKSEVIEARGFSPYLDRLEKLQKAKVTTAYLAAMRDNIVYAKRIAENAEQQGLGKVIHTDKFKSRLDNGRSITSTCIAFNLDIQESNSPEPPE